MQKLISSIIYIICLILLSLTCMKNINNCLINIAPYETYNSKLPLPSKEITAKSLNITSSAKEPDGMYSKAYCLIDADSNRILTSKEADTKLPMASTTKIMTCIIALEESDLNDVVTVSDYAASMPDVQLNMQSGDKFILGDLLYSLMLESHNDTAVAIAEHIGGSVEGFAKLMNIKASELGCTNTNFVTPNGLDDEKHYTTAYELCCIASYAIQNKQFLDIISTPSHSFTNYDGTRSYSVNNKDAFLTGYNGAIGIKTGFTGNAGYCFCGAAKRDGVTLISSVLACGWPPHKGYKWSDTKKLMDYGFKGYKKTSISPNKALPNIPVSNGRESSVPIKRTSTEPFSILMSADDTITVSYELPENLNAPVRSGDIIGCEKYEINGKLFAEIPIAVSKSVEETDLEYFMDIVMKLFFMKSV